MVDPGDVFSSLVASFPESSPSARTPICVGKVGFGVGVTVAAAEGVGLGAGVTGAKVISGVGEAGLPFLTSISVLRPKRFSPSLTTRTRLCGPSFGAVQVAVVPAPAPKSPPSGACQTGRREVSFGRLMVSVAERMNSFMLGQRLATSDWPEASDRARPARR